MLRRNKQPGRGKTREITGDVNKRRIALLQPDSFVAEQFRTLRARIDSIAAERPMKIIAMTSALAGEGKTTASINLAIVMSMQVEESVVLVDCDLRKPKVHGSLGLQPEYGLAEVLSGDADVDQALIRVEEVGLTVLPVRKQPSNPSELLSTDRMKRLIEELAGRFDHVILDTPATLALPDAKTLSALADGLVMVVRADSTPQSDVEAALEVLDRRRVLGLVLNGAEVPQGRYAYYPG